MGRGAAPPDPPRREPPATAAVRAAARPPGKAYGSFAEYHRAWEAVEAKVQAGAALHSADIPWPGGLPSVAGIAPGDGPADKKRKLRAALLRWHPDKWHTYLEKVVPNEREDVLSRVKDVTLRLLEEKARAS